MTVPGPAQPLSYHIVLLSFEGEDVAARALQEVRREGALEGCEIEAEALISRDDAGRIEVRERGAAGVGAAFGVATAGLVGLVTGPVFLLLLVVVGGVAGGIAGHFAGQALPPEDLREVGNSLPPGSSAYVAVVDAAHADHLVGAFAALEPSVLNVPVRTELASMIREAITHRVVVT